MYLNFLLLSQSKLSKNLDFWVKPVSKPRWHAEIKMGLSKFVKRNTYLLANLYLRHICFGQVVTDYIHLRNHPILPPKKPDFTHHLLNSDLQIRNFQNTKNCKRKSNTIACVTWYTTFDILLKKEVCIIWPNNMWAVWLTLTRTSILILCK